MATLTLTAPDPVAPVIIEQELEVDDEEDDEDAEDGDDEDEDEKERGPDPEEAKIRFGNIQNCLDDYYAAVEKHGIHSLQAEKCQIELSLVFSPVKLSPRYYERLVSRVREYINRIRTQERNIMRICTQRCKIPRKEFIKTFPGNETNQDWFQKLIDDKSDYSNAIAANLPDLQRAQRRLKAVTARNKY